MDDQYKSVPDPSPLTTAQLQREIASLKELIFSEIQGMKEAIEVSHDDLVRFPTEVQKAVGNLKDLHEEKFKSVDKSFIDWGMLRDEKFEGIEKQFKERDIRIEHAKTAADNALISAEKFVDKQSITLSQNISKSESSIMKQIELLGEKVNDIKDRLTTIEGQSSGKKDFWGYIIGVVGLVTGLIAIFLYMSKLKGG